MEKLIVVGMRFQNAASVAKVKSNKDKAGAVRLRVEPHPEGFKGEAIAVVSNLDGNIVGYVRNKDLNDSLIKRIKAFPNAVVKIQAVMENYWVILLSEVATQSEARLSASKFIDEYSKSIDGYSADYFVDTNPCSEIKLKTKNKETKMASINTNSMRDNFFREVKNVAIDIQTGKFGVLSNEGISVYTGDGISVNPLQELGVKIPAYAFRVAVADLNEGDIVINGSDVSFFRKATEKGYEVMTLNGEVKSIGNVTNMFFGKNTILAVRNMFGEGTNPMMMALLMGDSSEGFDMKTFALMSMMGGNSGMDGMNPMMLAMMLAK